MKNRNFLKNSIAILLPISMGIGVLLGTANKHVNSASAYTKDGTLPTTIDLRDNTAQEIKDYYSGLSSLSSSQLQGDNLLKNLKPILKNGQKYFAYDSSGDDLWKMYEIIDRDWEKSPASAITGYSSSTNKITGYTYGTSTSNKGTNPYIHALYVDRNVDNQTRAWDDHQQTQWGINREHIWPKSQGFDTTGAGGARGDPMHLWAGNGRVNGTEHNNNHYGFVDKSKAYTNPYEVKGFKNLKDNYSGKSLTIPTSTDTVFEPQDCDKGDIARAIFYMVARYNNIAGNDTIDTNNPNLALKQTTQSLASYTTTSSNKQTGYMGLMTDLLYWNHLDPVDEFEIHRNNLLFNNYTHNRNPFIDYPEWADYIWGKPVYNGRNYVSYSSTPTGSVNLSTDVINGFKGEQPQEVTVKSLEITKKPNKLVYNVGETLDTTGMVVKAHMSNNTTRTLSSGDYTVTPSGALKTSDTQVTVTYQNETASFAIGVKSSGSGSETNEKTLAFDFSTNPGEWPTANSTTLTNYSYNLDGTDYSFALKNGKINSGYLMLTQPAVLGLPAIANSKLTKVVAHTKSGASAAVNVGISSSPTTESYITGGEKVTWSNPGSDYTYNLTDASVNTVYYMYITNKNGQITGLDLTYESTVSPTPQVNVSSITLNKVSTTLEIGQSDNLSATIAPENATIQLVSWSSSNSEIVEVSDDGEITAKSAGNATITCAALDGSEVTATCTITVSAPVTLQSITLSGQYPTEFYLGDSFSSDGLIVTANYSDNTHIDVTDDVEITGYDMDTVGEQTVSVTYGDKTSSYQIEIKEKGLADNEILFVASQQGLVNGDDLTSYTDSVATVTFTKNSGTQPKYYSSTSTFRVYAKNSFTISGTKNIIKIEFEMASSDTVGSNAISANVGSLSGTTWTGNESSVVFTVGGTSGQRNIVSIKVTYDENSEEILALSSISLSGSYKTEYFTNESFSSEGLVVTAHYSDGSESVVTPTSISSPTMSTAGTKTITVTYTENNVTKQASFNIEVSAIVGVSIELTGNYKTDYEVGDDFSTSGMTVVEHKNNGATANHLPSSCTFTGYDLSSPGDQTVTVDYHGLTTTYTIHVTGVAVKTYVATILPSDFTTTSYDDNNGEHIIVAVNANNSEDTRNITIVTNQVYQNSNAMQWQKNTGFLYNSAEIGNITSVVIDSSAGTFYTCFGNSAIGTHQTGNSSATSGKYFNVSVGGATGTTKSVVITFSVTEGGSEKELSSIAVSGDYKTSFNVGDDFSFGGTVTATYSDETTEDVTESATFSGYDLSTAGEQTVTVTYDGKTTTYTITVSQSSQGQTTTVAKTAQELFNTVKEDDSVVGGNSPTCFTSIPVDDVITMSTTGSANCGGFFGTADKISDWRLYQNRSGNVTFDASEGYIISTVKVSFTTSNNGVLLNGETAITSGSVIAVNDSSITFTVGNSNVATTNGQVKITAVEVVYKEVTTAQNYSLVTDVSDLRTGDKIVIAAPNTSPAGVTTYYSLSTNRNITSTIYGCEIDFNNNVVAPTDETELITVERNGNDLSFKLSDGKYIASYGNSQTINLVDSSSDPSARFTATANTDNSIKLISENTDHNYRRLKFNYSSGNLYYRCFTTNSSTGVDPMIFKYQPQVEADTWAKDFLAKTEYCDLTYWSSLASSYNELSAAAKQEIYSAVSDASTDMNYRAQAMARYEKTLSVKSADAFISERQVDSVRPLYLPIIAPKTDTILIVVFSILGVSAIGGYYFVKRKKEDRV